jgi:transcriptional regulator NrdR family protein
MASVLKKNGEKEKFDSDKIKRSIKKSVIDAKLSLSEMKKDIEKVSNSAINLVKGKTEIATKALRDRILRDFDSIKKSVSDAWRKFDSKYKSKKN